MTMNRPHSSQKGQFAEVNGARLYYELAGDGQVLVFVHAGIADSRMWDAQFHVFAEDYRVVRYDIRGAGRSDSLAGSYSHHEDLRGLLGHLGVDCVAIVAASMGGEIALDFTLSYPEMVKALVLCGSGVGYVPPSEERRQRGSEIEDAFLTGDLALANELEVQMWVDGPSRMPEDVDPAVRGLVAEMNLALLASMPETDERVKLDPPAQTRLDEIDIPTLIITGDLDMPDVASAADLLATGIEPRGYPAQRVTIPGAAHMANMEESRVFNRIVDSFLSHIDS